MTDPIPTRPVPTLALTPTDKAITITADERNRDVGGNMSHRYHISYPHKEVGEVFQQIDFQCGPIAECGVNGITNESLIAIVIDRLNGAQEGPFKSRDNALAITALEQASLWLAKRTLDRVARGVEGQSKA